MTKVLAIDIGFASAGMAVLGFQDGRAVLHATACAHTRKLDKKLGIYVAHDDVRRAQEITRAVIKTYTDNSCKGVVVELPSAGAKGAKANRAMGISTGIIAALTEIVRCPVEWITPSESRSAAIGRATAPKGGDVKDLVMKAMTEKYPEIAGLKVVDKEHIADALATFEAARGRQLLRLMEGM